MKIRDIAFALAMVFAAQGPAGAAIIHPLNTLGEDISASDEAYPVYANFEWQEIAVPFHLANRGRLLRIQTGLTYDSGTTSLLMGIGRGELVGESFPDSVFEKPICGPVPNERPAYCQQDTDGESTELAPGEFFDWRGSLFLEPGDYWLYASLRGDNVFGRWYANPDIVSDDFATRGCALSYAQGTECNWGASEWDFVSNFGPAMTPGGGTEPGGYYATPMARLSFVPVSEPSAAALITLGLLGLIIVSSRTGPSSLFRKSAGFWQRTAGRR